MADERFFEDLHEANIICLIIILYSSISVASIKNPKILTMAKKKWDAVFFYYNLKTIYINYLTYMSIFKSFKNSTNLDQAEIFSFIRFQMTLDWSWRLIFAICQNSRFQKLKISYFSLWLILQFKQISEIWQNSWQKESFSNFLKDGTKHNFVFWFV